MSEEYMAKEKVFFVNNEYEAKEKVYVVSEPSLADRQVYEVSQRYLADTLVYRVSEPHLASAAAAGSGCLMMLLSVLAVIVLALAGCARDNTPNVPATKLTGVPMESTTQTGFFHTAFTVFWPDVDLLS